MKVEINGPASYAMWRASFTVYRNCLVMLDAVDLGKLLSYLSKQDQYQEKYGSRVWALQYQTDVRTRSEHFIRVKREAMSDYDREYKRNLDWYKDEEGESVHDS